MTKKTNKAKTNKNKQNRGILGVPLGTPGYPSGTPSKNLAKNLVKTKYMFLEKILKTNKTTKIIYFELYPHPEKESEKTICFSLEGAPGGSRDTRTSKTIGFIVFSPANVSKMNVWSIFISKTLIKAVFF